MTFNMVTAHEAHAQGLEAAAFLSISRIHAAAGNHRISNAAFAVAREIAKIDGRPYESRKARNYGNDNRKPHHQKRRAA